MAWFARIFDGRDSSAEAHLALSCLAVLALIGLQIYSVVWGGNPFDAIGYGTGVGATFAGTGAAAWGQGMQRKSERAVGEEGSNS